MNIPYTGSGVMASALSLDKWRTKLVWRALELPVARDELVNERSDWARIARTLGLPLIIKPVHEGSTLGLTKVRTAAELPAAYQLAARYDRAVLAEEFVDGQELTAGVLGDRVLPLIRIEAPDGNYDYQNKYFSDDTQYHCPSGIRADLEERIQRSTLAAFQALGCAGWGRADLILRADGSYVFLEMNTSPGMTGHSLVPMAARQAGLSFSDLVLRILESARVE
jgi:D-alanine-D-alanine ligase